MDASGNMASGNTVGVIVSNFILDDIAPILTNFSLDVNDSSLTLTFSEPVSAESLKVSGISLQANVTMSASYRLTSSSTSSTNGNEILISLSDFDLNQIKFNSLAGALDDTFVTIDSITTRDLALQPTCLLFLWEMKWFLFVLLPEDVVDLKSSLALATDLAVVGVIRDVSISTLTTPLAIARYKARSLHSKPPIQHTLFDV